MRLEPQVSFIFIFIFYLLTIITTADVYGTEWKGRNIGTRDGCDGENGGSRCGENGGLETRLEARYVPFSIYYILSTNLSNNRIWNGMTRHQGSRTGRFFISFYIFSSTNKYLIDVRNDKGTQQHQGTRDASRAPGKLLFYFIILSTNNYY